MIKAINAGDKNELRKLLKMYSQAIYQRALATTENTEHAKEVTRLVLSYVAACAASGTCQENVDAWLMSVTDAHANRYMENIRLEEEAKKSYFTAPTALGTAPSSTAYDVLKQPIYENAPEKNEEEKSEFIPFSPTLSIPECPEFAARQDEYSTQSRISGVTPAPPIRIENGQPREFVPPQYVPPQYNPVQTSSVMDEINAQNGAENVPNYFADPAPAQNTGYSVSNTPEKPTYEVPQAQFAEPVQEAAPSSHEASAAPSFSDNIMPVSLTDDDDEEVLSKKKQKKQKKQKKKSGSGSGVLIAVITIILLLVVGVLIAEIVSILIS